MREYIPLNKLQVNQSAKKALMSIGEPPNQTSLYLQQLLNWSLESGTLQTIHEVEEIIGLMHNLSPQAWMDRVTNHKKEEGVPVATKETDPEKLAWMILDEIESQYRVQTG